MFQLLTVESFPNSGFVGSIFNGDSYSYLWFILGDLTEKLSEVDCRDDLFQKICDIVKLTKNLLYKIFCYLIHCINN